MEKHSKIYITGYLGLVGSALKSRLVQAGISDLIYRAYGDNDENRKQQAWQNSFKKKSLVFFLAAA